MIYNFDQVIDRRNTDSSKWQEYGDDIIPLWVADMDFASPEPILQAMHQRVDHGVFGYARPPARLAELICERMLRQYNWSITPEDIIFLPGLVCGLNVMSRAIGQPGDGILIQPPVYGPFISAPDHQGRVTHSAELTLIQNGPYLDYEIDFDAFEAAITPRTRLFLLCHPHNPIGRSFTEKELTHLAEICLRHNIVICSDEIHNELLLGEATHIPTAALNPEIAQQCITLIAPSKTFNIPGLGCSIAIIQNLDLMQQVWNAKAGIVPHLNLMGVVAAIAAYSECDAWLQQLLVYLRANRDYLTQYIADYMPALRITFPTATYLVWIDCRALNIDGSRGNGVSIGQFFINQAKIALQEGTFFGEAGQGFMRLNFGCPKETLIKALKRMREALEELEAKN